MSQKLPSSGEFIDAVAAVRPQRQMRAMQAPASRGVFRGLLIALPCAVIFWIVIAWLIQQLLLS